MASIYHLLNRQIPAHIREQNPVFCKFIEYYYRWLQTRGFDKLEKVTNIDYECQAIALKDCFSSALDQEGLPIAIDAETFARQFVGFTIINSEGVVAEIVGSDQDRVIVRYLTQDKKFGLNDDLFVRTNTTFTVNENKVYDRAVVSQLQTLPSAYIDHFTELLDSDNIFDKNSSNIALILKHVKQLYQSKGSEQALKYILKATKNIDAEIRYPRDQILKPSDGRWSRQFAVNIDVDDNYWGNIRTDFDTVICEIPSKDPNQSEPERVERRIVKLEVFGRQSLNYDINEEQWWIREDDDPDSNEPIDGILDPDKLADPDSYDENGDLKFKSWQYPDGYPYTYGRFGDRKVTPHVRMYFEDDPEVFEGQTIKVIDKYINDEGLHVEEVVFQGTVTLGVKGFDIVQPGKMWQIGQIFTTNKEGLWQIYNEPSPQLDDGGFIIPNSIQSNDKGVLVQYSADVPLIGRVTAVGPRGEIQGVEIVQLGDHLPYKAAKRIVVSPLFNDTVESSPYEAELDLVYGAQTDVMGYFEDNRGMLSDNDIRLQDNFYYQQFSYDIVANVDPSTYIDIAEKLHPAGSMMFTTYVLEADLDDTTNADALSTGVDLAVSLFDVAAITDHLAKTVIKPFQDKTSLIDKLTLLTIKRLRDDTIINDMEQDRIYLTEREFAYDAHDSTYFERTMNASNANTSYCEVGVEKRLYINYEYHTINKTYKLPGEV